MKAFVDFHIHSCLSPCASLDMSPREIVARSQRAGMNCIALTDHNCTRNLPAFHRACVAAGMHCLYGLEVTTAEEVHVLCLFDQLAPAVEFGEMIYARIPEIKNDPERFGEQPVITVDEEIIEFVDKLLVYAADISYFDLIPMALAAGALCIPAHIDREMYGALNVLGFLPELPYDALEAVNRQMIDKKTAARWPVIQSSDAHAPEHIGRRYTEIDTAGFSVPELREAFLHTLKNH
ncbi:MAG: PHP domain-containing protein [Kiritimatiellales bacterium]